MRNADATTDVERSPIGRRFASLADWLAVAVAVLLPWSTSATLIAAALWLLALAPTLDISDLRLARQWSAAILPIALVVLAALGMLWADAPWSERLQGLSGLYRLLIIPLLMIQFSRSDRGRWVLGGFLVSCAGLLLMSWLVLVWPSLAMKKPFEYEPGVPVRDRLAQSAEFVICIFALTHVAIESWIRKRRVIASLCCIGAVLFGLNLAFVSTSRTALAVLPLLFVVMGAQRFGWRGAAAATAAVAVLAVGGWSGSPYLRERVASVLEEVKQAVTGPNTTSIGFRVEFWDTALELIVRAPVIGHGTGSIPSLFRRAADEGAIDRAFITDNPHNQTLLIALQLGVVGVAVLWAMWVAHFMLFVHHGLPSWIGLGVVIQNIVSSLANSHLTDFAPGWLYVIGVGVLGGIVQRDRARDIQWNGLCKDGRIGRDQTSSEELRK
jgi:O-antigen ligase